MGDMTCAISPLHVSQTEPPKNGWQIQLQTSNWLSLMPHKMHNRHLLGVFAVIAWGWCISTQLIERVSGTWSPLCVIRRLTSKNTGETQLLFCLIYMWSTFGCSNGFCMVKWLKHNVAVHWHKHDSSWNTTQGCMEVHSDIQYFTSPLSSLVMFGKN